MYCRRGVRQEGLWVGDGEGSGRGISTWAGEDGDATSDSVTSAGTAWEFDWDADLWVKRAIGSLPSPSPSASASQLQSTHPPHWVDGNLMSYEAPRKKIKMSTDTCNANRPVSLQASGSVARARARTGSSTGNVRAEARGAEGEGDRGGDADSGTNEDSSDTRSPADHAAADSSNEDMNVVDPRRGPMAIPRPGGIHSTVVVLEDEDGDLSSLGMSAMDLNAAGEATSGDVSVAAMNRHDSPNRTVDEHDAERFKARSVSQETQAGSSSHGGSGMDGASRSGSGSGGKGTGVGYDVDASDPVADVD